MRRLLIVVALVALGVFLAISLVAAQTVAPTASDPFADSAVAPSVMGARTSHTLVQNMEATSATVHVDYYRTGSAVVAASDDAILGPFGAKTFHANQYPTLGTGFLGSMVVSSDKKVVAVVINAGSTSHDIYEGASQGSLSQFLPSVHWYSAQSTQSGFQNTDPAVTATVSITYFSQCGNVLTTFTEQIPPNTAIHHNALNDVLAEDIPCPRHNVGSILATADRPIVVAAVETLYDETYSYRGFSPDQGATEVFLPSVHRNPLGQYSHTLVQNMTNADNTVTMTYYNQAGDQVDQFTRTIAANGSTTFHTTNDTPENIPQFLGNVGSAKLTSTGNIVAVVIETIGPATAYSYDGQIAGDAGNSLLFPSVHRNPGGQFSHILIQNKSQTDSINVEAHYFNQAGAEVDVKYKTIQPRGSFTFHTVLAPDPTDIPQNLGDVGSLRVVCTNCGTGDKKIFGVNIETLTLTNIPSAYAGFAEN